MADGERLRRYRAKRDFSTTPEPAGAQGARAQGAARAAREQAGAAAREQAGAAAREQTGAPAGALRFVIHEHSARRLHWDLRLEHEGALASWALPKGLPQERGRNHFAAHTEDHPLEYVDFDGEIPKGSYGAGTMRIWDRGTYECLKWEARKVEVALHGERARGRYALFAIEQGERPKDWMIHRMDAPERDAAGGHEAMPEHVVPMLARAGELPADEQGWAYEIKWDGVRALVYSRPGELRVESRNLNEVTDSYPELARLNRALSWHSAVLDGEIVALDARGRPSFAALQGRMHVASRAQARRLAERTRVTLMLFDLLWLDGHSLMGLGYGERRELLAELRLNGESWQMPEHVTGGRGEGGALLRAASEQGLEGVVAKRVDSTYQPGVRARGWVKVKSTGRQEFVVGGWLRGKGKRRGTIGALLLGVYERDGVLRYVGRVGSGFDEAELRRLSKLLARLERERSPFGAGERPPREAIFSEPRVVAEVRFAHWTQGGSLRAPVYVGLREDKDPTEVVREDAGVGYGSSGGEEEKTTMRRGGGVRAGGALRIEEGARGSALARVGGRALKLSNLEKVLYPRTGTDKRAVIDYYARIAPVLLAHLAGRALTVTRWPDGVEGKRFFQKQAPAHRPEWVRTVALRARGKLIDYVLAQDEATLVWLANLAALELHVPLARAQHVERPTAVVLDLDPGAPAGVLECARVALLLRDVLAGVGLESVAKTSGSKGIQVYVPLNDEAATFEHTKRFAKTVAELLEQAERELVISRMTRAKRTGKVLIDWGQNDANKTTVCAYSLRATERPTVSTPLAWEELRRALDERDAAALRFEAGEALARVQDKGDLFAPVLWLVQELPG